MRRASLRDKAEPDIIKALEAVGASVEQISKKGVPDLLVGFRGVTYLLEVKTPGACKSGNNAKANRGQTEWMAGWRGGPAVVVETPLQALNVIGIIPAVPTQGWTGEMGSEANGLIPAPRRKR